MTHTDPEITAAAKEIHRLSSLMMTLIEQVDLGLTVEMGAIGAVLGMVASGSTNPELFIQQATTLARRLMAARVAAQAGRAGAQK